MASESLVDYIHFNPREEFIHYTASNYPKEYHFLSEEFTKYYQCQYHFVSDYIVNRMIQKSLMITVNKDICFVNPRYQVKISLCFGFSREYKQYIYEWFKGRVNFVAVDLVLVKEPLVSKESIQAIDTDILITNFYVPDDMHHGDLLVINNFQIETDYLNLVVMIDKVMERHNNELAKI